MSALEHERISWLAGWWDLVESTHTATDGSVLTPWGAAPLGVLVVTPAGDLSAHGGRSARAFSAGDHPTPEEKRQAYETTSATTVASCVSMTKRARSSPWSTLRQT